MIRDRVMGRAHRIVLALVLLAILGVSIVDVAGRYLFNAPLLGADDLIRFGMALMVFVALPAVCLAGDHVSVDILTVLLPPAVVAAATRAWRIVAALILAFLAWRLAILGLNATCFGDSSPLLLLPYAPLMLLMAACSGIAALIELALAWRPSLAPPPRAAGR